jgi:hypothetical protein
VFSNSNTKTTFLILAIRMAFRRLVDRSLGGNDVKFMKISSNRCSETCNSDILDFGRHGSVSNLSQMSALGNDYSGISATAIFALWIAIHWVLAISRKANSRYIDSLHPKCIIDNGVSTCNPDCIISPENEISYGYS